MESQAETRVKPERCPACLTEELTWTDIGADWEGWLCVGCGSLVTEEGVDAIERLHDRAELAVEEELIRSPLDELAAMEEAA